MVPLILGNPHVGFRVAGLKMLHLYKQEERPRIVGQAKAKGPSAYMVLGSHGFLHKHFGF